MEKKVDYSFKVLEEVLTLKPYESREEVLAVANKMIEIVEENEYSDNIKNIYKEAMKKINLLNFDEMKEIISILASKESN